MSEQEKNVDYKQPDTEHAAEKLVLTSPETAATTKDFALWIGVMLLAILVVFSPALSGKFLWEDETHLVGNPLMRSAEGLARMWNSPRLQAQYRPLTDTLFWIQLQLMHPDASQDLNPFIFHLVNVLLHATSAALLWFVLRRLAVPGAWVAALLWAVHPVNVESAAWISQLGNPLSSSLLFGSVLAWLGFERIGGNATETSQDQRMDSYGVSLLLFAGAVLANPMVCVAPLVMLLILWWKREKISSRECAFLAPFLVVMILGLAFLASTATEGNLSAAQRFLLAGRAAWFYLAKLFVPTKLNFLYPRWDMSTAPPWWWIFPLAVPVALMVLLALRERIGKAPFVALAAYFSLLIPALITAGASSQMSYLSDQDQYHASVAIVAMVVGAIAFAVGRAMSAKPQAAGEPSPAPFAIAAVVVVALGAMAVARANVFSGPVPLWRDVLAKNPGSFMAHNNLGRTLFEDAIKMPLAQRSEEFVQMLDEAESQFSDAIKLNPAYAKAYANWGAVLLFRDNLQGAQEKYERAAVIDPLYIDGLAGLARVQLLQKNYPQAAQRYREAAKLADADRTISRAGRAELHAGLGDALVGLGDDKGAFEEYSVAISNWPDAIRAHLGNGKLLARNGNLGDAAREFAQVIRVQPDSIEARLELARAMMKVGNLTGAENLIVESSAIDPASPLLISALAEWNARYLMSLVQWYPFKPPAPKRATSQPATTRAAGLAA